MGAEGPRTSRERLGRKSADGTTPEHTQHQVQEGESGAEARYRYTNKKSERSPYIAERAKLAHTGGPFWIALRKVSIWPRDVDVIW